MTNSDKIKSEVIKHLATRYFEARDQRDECKTREQERVFENRMERLAARAEQLEILDEFIAAIN